MENGKQRVWNFVMNTRDSKYLLEKLDIVLDSLKCAAKLNLAFGFALKNVEDGSCRYNYGYENITLLERSKHVATTEEYTTVKIILSNTAVIESCT